MNGQADDRKVKQRRIQVGGTLNPDRDIYISRPEDDELFNLLLDGQYANVLTSRQTGKSSLVISAIYRLRDRGMRTAYVDLTSIGTPENVKSYYYSLLDKVTRGLELNASLNQWWQRVAADTINQQLMSFFREVVCIEAAPPAVIVLDEIDSTLKLNYTDDLFTALRAMYNERPLVPAYERITFCLVGVATPNELIKDRRTTAYNVGRTLELRDFDATRDDLAPLAAALSVEPSIGNAMLDRVLHWTSGHPYLTMRVAQNMIERGAESATDVDRLIEEMFLTLDRVSRDVHFEQILRFIETRLSHGLDSLSLYQEVLRGKRERDSPILAHAELKLSGLVKRDLDGFLVVRNPIYERLFDLHWVEGVNARLSRRVEELETQLREREQLAGLGVTVTSDKGKLGNTVQFLRPISQEEFEEAVPLLRAAAPVVLLNLGNTQVSDITVLSGLRHLQLLDLTRTLVSDITVLSDLTQLQSLNLGNTQVSDITALSGLRQLQSLDLMSTSVFDITALSGLRQLQSLELLDTQVSDISVLSGLRQLQSLDLGNTRVSEITSLSGLRQLQSLDLGHTRVSDITSLSGLRQLQSLDLGHTRISDITSLSGLRQLQSLDLGHTWVSEITSLSGLTQLQSLDLGHTRVSEITSLSGLTQLQSLDLGHTWVSEITSLSGLTQLQSLDLRFAPVSDVTALSDLTHLQSLNLRNTRVSELTALSGLRQLQSLNLISTSTSVSDITSLSGLTHLQSLNLRFTQVSDIMSLSGLRQLQSLDLRDTRVTPGDVAALRQALAANGNRSVEIIRGGILAKASEYLYLASRALLGRLWPFR